MNKGELDGRRLHLSKQGGAKTQPSPSLRLRCPACRHLGTLVVINSDVHDLYTDLAEPGHNSNHVNFGHRRCPNDDCRLMMTVIYSPSNNEPLVTYPAEVVDFDATAIPPAVLAVFEEAVICHSTSCFVAAGMMLRKTLEVMCADRGAEGDTLNARIKALGELVVLPRELLDGIDLIRLLGNDAAHVESRTYAELGKDEIDVTIALVKEILKAVYQYASLLASLRALKKDADSGA